MKKYNFGSVTSVEFCDLYLELVKPVVSTRGGASGTDEVVEQRRVAQVGGGVELV
jgi:hypothetical protein